MPIAINWRAGSSLRWECATYVIRCHKITLIHCTQQPHRIRRQIAKLFMHSEHSGELGGKINQYTKEVFYLLCLWHHFVIWNISFSIKRMTQIFLKRDNLIILYSNIQVIGLCLKKLCPHIVNKNSITISCQKWNKQLREKCHLQNYH